MRRLSPRHRLRAFVRKVLVLSQVVSLLIGTAPAMANPHGAEVVAGSASLNAAGSALSITTSDKAIINWQGFSIGAGETTRFIQPGATSAVLNRVVSGDPSSLLGTLSANGQVYLINPNGILVGPGANINVGAFTASTLDVDNNQFLRGGTLDFHGNSEASIVNHGTIRALDGDVYLIGSHVANYGAIHAPNGQVGLAAGQHVRLVDSNHPALVVSPSGKSLGGTGIHNAGTIEAIQAKLAVANGNVYALAINNEGTIRATAAVERDGRIYLTGHGGKMLNSGTMIAKSGAHGGRIAIDAGATGSVEVSGTLDAAGSQTGGTGGAVKVEAGQIKLAGAQIDASGPAGGGTVLIGGDSETGSVALANYTQVDAATRIDARATLAGDGGLVEVSGRVLDFRGTVDTSAVGGATGRLVLDPTNMTIDSTVAANLSGNLATTNVELRTSDAGSEAGNVTFLSGANISWSSDSSFTVLAHNDIVFDTGSSITNTGSGSLLLRADLDADGAGTVVFGGMVAQIDFSSSVGDIRIQYNRAGGYTSPTDYTGNVLLGSGQLTAQMLVNNLTDLDQIRTNLAGDYVLGADIDASPTAGWNGVAGFVPIGGAGNAFTGTLDGDGHTIAGLTVNRPGANFTGLFGLVDGATLCDIEIANPDIAGAIHVAALAGVAQNSTITNCDVTGITASVNGDINVGGIVGRSESSTIENCLSLATTGGEDSIGGLVGSMVYTTVSGCSAHGGVAGERSGSQSQHIGGLVGYSYDSTITYSHATGTVTGNIAAQGTYNVGGLVGISTNDSTITECYASGSVTGTANPAIYHRYVGGLVGMNQGSEITASYATGTVVGHHDTGGLVGVNLGSATIKSSYATGNVTAYGLTVGGLVGWNRDSTSRIIDSYATGSVSGYRDGSIFYYVGGLVGANDVHSGIEGCYATGFVTGNTGTGGAEAVGGLVGLNRASSSIDESYATGNVAGTSGTAQTAKVGGLVGECLDNSAITNAYATGSVTGGDKVGGLVGANDTSDIANAYATGDVAGNAYVGGLIGWNEDSYLSNAYASGNVTADLYYAGGLIGFNAISDLSNVYATGNVHGGSTVIGGLVGGHAVGTIANAYAWGDVEGLDSVGGLVGFNANAGAKIENAYATGKVTVASGNTAVGGLVGTNTGSISHSFWDTTTSCTSIGVGSGSSAGVTGLPTVQMQKHITFTSATWDFTNTWHMIEGQTYPLFQYQPFPGVPLGGTVYLDAGTTAAGAGVDVSLAIDGVIIGTTQTTAGGAYSFLVDSTLLDDTGLVVYLDGGTSLGAAGFHPVGSSITDLDIYTGTLIARSGGVMSNALFGQAGTSLLDADIPYITTTVGSTVNLTLLSGVSFLLPAGNAYTLDGNITTDGGGISMLGATTLLTSATLTTSSAHNVHLGGTFSWAADYDLAVNSGGGIWVSSSLDTLGGNLTLASTGGTVETSGGAGLQTQGGTIDIRGDRVYLRGDVASGGGTLTVEATSYLETDSTDIYQVESSGGAIEFAVGPGGTFAAGMAMSSDGGTVVVTADRVAAAGFYRIDASGAGTVVYRPATAGLPIDLGAAHSGSELNLSKALLNTTTAAQLVLGSSNAGTVYLSDSIALASTTGLLHIQTGDTIVDAGGSLTVSSLVLDAAGGIGTSLAPLQTSVDRIAASAGGSIYAGNATSFETFASTTSPAINGVLTTAGSDGDIELTATVGTITVNTPIRADGAGHVTLNAAGAIDLAGSAVVETDAGELVLSASTGIDIQTGSQVLSASGKVSILASAGVINVNGSVQATTGNATVTGDTVNLASLIGVGGTLSGASSIVNVANSASIQQGVDIMATGGTVNVDAGTYAESVTIDDTLTLRSVGGMVTAQSWDSSATSISLAGDFAASAGGMALGPIVLLGHTQLETPGGTTAEGIATGAVTGNGNNLTLDAGTNGAISVASINPVDVLTIVDSGQTTFTGPVEANTVDIQATTGTVAFQGNLTVHTALLTTASGYAVSITGDTNTVAGATTFLNTGTVTLGKDGATTQFAAGLDTAGGPSLAYLGGLVEASAGEIVFGHVELLANTAVLASGGNIQFQNTVDGGYQLGAEGGEIRFLGVVGGNTPLNSLGARGARVELGQNVTVTNLAGFDTSISLIQTGGGLTAPELLLLGSGQYTLNSVSNHINTMAADVQGNVRVTNAQSLAVGTVHGTAGITTGDGNLCLALLAGDLQVNRAIDAGAGTVRLNLAGGVSQTTAGTITAEALGVVARGAIDLPEANDVNTLAVRNELAGASVAFNDVDGFDVASVTAGGCFASDVVGVSAIAGGSIRLTADADIRVTSLVESGVGPIDLVAGGNVTIDAGVVSGGAERIRIEATDGVLGTTTTGYVENATGNIQLIATHNAGTAIDLQGHVQSGGGNLLVKANEGDIATGGAGYLDAGSGRVTLQAQTGVTAGARITADRLLLLGTGSGDFVAANSGNSVNTLAADVQGNVRVTNAQSLAVGTVHGTAGITTGDGNLCLTLLAGDLQVNRAIDAGAGAARLNLAGGVSQTTAGTITAEALGVVARGAVDLPEANDVNTLAVRNELAGASVAFNDVDGFDVASVTAGGCFASDVVGVSAIAGGSIRLTADADIRVTSLVESGVGPIHLVAGGNVTIDAGVVSGGAERIRIEATDGVLGTTTTGYVENATGNIQLIATHNAGTAIDLQGHVQSGGGNLLVKANEGDIATGGAGYLDASSGRVTLQAQTGVTAGARITADRLLLLGTGSGDFIAANSGNSVNTLAADVQGNVRVTNAQSLAVGTVHGTAGITTGDGNLCLTLLAGDLQVNRAIDAGAGAVRLNLAGGVSQTTAGTITAEALGVVARGAVDLPEANDVNTLAVRNELAGASVAFNDVDGFDVASVTAGGCFASDVVGVSAIAGGSIRLTADADIRVTSLVESGVGPIDLVAGSNVTIDAGVVSGGAERIRIEATDGVLGTTTTGYVENATGNIQLIATHNAGTAIDLQGHVQSGGGNLLVKANEGAIATDGAGYLDAGSGRVTLQAQTGVTAGARITADRLLLLGTGSGDFVATNSGNSVNTLAADVQGNVRVTNAQSLAVGTVHGTAGITTGDGNLCLTLLAGDLQVNRAIDAGAGAVRLNLAGGVSQTTAGTITAEALGVVARGAVDLPEANDVNTLAVRNELAGASVAFNDVDGFDVASVTAGACFASDVVGVSAIAGGSIRLTADADIRVTSLVESGVGPIDLVAGGNVTIDAGVVSGGAERIRIEATDGVLGTTTTGYVENATGNIQLIATHNAGTAIDLQGHVQSGGSNLLVKANEGAIATDGAGYLDAGSGRVTLQAQTGVTAGARITADRLLLLGTGSGDFIAANSGNSVNTLAADVQGNVRVTNAQSLAVGTVHGTAGITTGDGNLCLTLLAGDLQVNRAIDAGAGAVRLNLAGGVSQTTAGTITAEALGVVARGAVDLPEANDVNTLAVRNRQFFAAVAFNDVDGFDVATVSAGGCFAADVVGVRTLSGGAITLNADSGRIRVLDRVVSGGSGKVLVDARDGAVVIAGSGEVTSDWGTITLNAARGMRIAGLIQTGSGSANAVRLNAGQDIRISGGGIVRTIGGDITMLAGADINVAGAVESWTGAVSFDATTDLHVRSGGLVETFSGPILLGAGSNVEVRSGLIQSCLGEIDLVAGGDIRLIASAGDSRLQTAWGDINVLAGGNLWLTGSASGGAMLGSVFGKVDVTAGENVELTSGLGFAQIGHDGAAMFNNVFTAADSHVSVHAGGNISLTADQAGGHAQIGHAGNGLLELLGDDIDVEAYGQVRLRALACDSTAQIGHGGHACVGAAAGAINVAAGTGPYENGVELYSGGENSTAQIGHGGRGYVGLVSGDITVETSAHASVRAVSGYDHDDGRFTGGNTAQIGHGGAGALAIAHGDITVITASRQDGIGMSIYGYGAGNTGQVGHGGWGFLGTAGGNVAVDSIGSVHLYAWGSRYLDQPDNDGPWDVQGGVAQIGHGGQNAGGHAMGSITITSSVADAYGNGLFLAAADQGIGLLQGTVQVGHGGREWQGIASGDIAAKTAGTIGLWSSGVDSDVQIGHGGRDSGRGALTGDITAITDASLRMGGTTDGVSLIGHGGQGSTSVTAGDILIGYDQADPSGYGPGIFQMQANARIGVARHESPTGRVSIFGTKACVVGDSWSTSLWIEDGAVISGIGYDSTLPGNGLLLPGPAAWKQHYPFIEWTHEQYGHTLADASDPALPYAGPFTFFFVGPGLPVDDLNAFNAAVHDRFERIPWNVVPSFLPYTASYGDPPNRPADQLTGLSSYDLYGGGSPLGGPVGNP